MLDESERLPVGPDAGEPGDQLVGRDWSAGVEIQDGRGLRAAISNAMVGLKKHHYGKGPTKARTYIQDNFVFCVLEGGLTRNEETLLDAGQEELVRNYRLQFQQAMAASTTGAIAKLTGCEVIGYHSQIVFDPAYGFEIFVLDRPPDLPAR